MTSPASASQVAVMGEALADALHAVAISPPGTKQCEDALTQAKRLYSDLGNYLLTPEQRTAADLLHKE